MAVAVRSDAQSTEANSSSCVVPKPSGLTAGDLMVAHITARTDVTVTNPGSWTTIRSETISGVLTSHLAWKIADSGDAAASNFTFTLSGSTVNLGSITAFTGHHTSSPIGANNGTATGSNSTTCSSAAITPAAADSMICFFATMGGSNGDAQIGSYTIATSAPTFVEQYESYTELGNDITYSMACGLRTATTSTGTGTATLEISRNNIGQLIAISPAAAGTTISVPRAQISVNKFAPTIATTANVFIAVPRAQIQVNGKTPTVKLNTNIAVPLAQLSLNKFAPTIAATANVFIAVPLAQIQVNKFAPVVATTANVLIAVPRAQINVAGLTPVVGASVSIAVPLAQIGVSAYTPTLFILDPKTVAVPLAQISLGKANPAAIVDLKIAIPVASINVNKFAPIILTSGPQVILVPLAQIRVGKFSPVVSGGGMNSGLMMMGIGS